ncbi:MarR family transcriptional regulator [Halococcus salsus]|uniref:MarR family transcriptional regulator n=1 Tax=Halococcus salsus TaxID=2162894 RepID=UPI003B835AA7
MSDTPDQQLLDLPPSAKLVFVVLGQKGPLTQKQIANEPRLSQRTVHYAIQQFEEIDSTPDNRADLLSIRYTYPFVFRPIRML